MPYGLDPVGRLTTRNSRFLFRPKFSLCCPTFKSGRFQFVTKPKEKNHGVYPARRDRQQGSGGHR